MGFILSCLLLLAFTTFAQKRRYFLSGLSFLALSSIAILNIINPDAFIAKTNLQQSLSATDYVYLNRLSADALPTMVEHFKAHPSQALKNILKNKPLHKKEAWQTWTWYQYKARLIKKQNVMEVSHTMI